MRRQAGDRFLCRRRKKSPTSLGWATPLCTYLLVVLILAFVPTSCFLLPDSWRRPTQRLSGRPPKTPRRRRQRRRRPRRRGRRPGWGAAAAAARTRCCSLSARSTGARSALSSTPALRCALFPGAQSFFCLSPWVGTGVLIQPRRNRKRRGEAARQASAFVLCCLVAQDGTTSFLHSRLSHGARPSLLRL